MPRTLDEGFSDFLDRLKATPTETEGAKSHRSSISTCLANNFGLKRFTRIGSFGNGTSIAGYSDVDYLAALPTSQLTAGSTYSMGKVRDALDYRFPYTGVHVSCPAIVLPFGTVAAERTEIVIADEMGVSGNFKVYDIPDCANGWMKASPDAHNHYVDSIHEQLYRKVKPLIRYVKAWKYLRDVPIKSFYLEMRIAKYCYNEKAIIYPIDLRHILKQLLDSGLAGMQDPMGISGYISACKTEAKRIDALSKLETAFTRADKAYSAYNSGETSKAFDWLQLLFNNAFPNYYY